MNERIHAFANFYLSIFRDPKATDSQVVEGFAEKCFALGFEMDCGHSFCDRYTKAFHDVQEFNKIIEEIDDPQFLGTAIFSRWRYITYWTTCSSPLDEKCREWFTSAFERLAEITAKKDCEVNIRDRIDRITIDYHSKIAIANVKQEHINHLVIDRESGTIENTFQITGRYDTTRKYHAPRTVRGFLDRFDARQLFTEFNEPDDDIIGPTEKIADYEVKVEFHRQEPRVISGKYDRHGLSLDWADFINELYCIVTRFDLGDLFDAEQYCRIYRRKSDRIFLSVRFGDYGKTYYYLTEDDTIEVGDKVVVPVGCNGKERIVEVSKKEYFPTDEVPMPLEKVKPIIEKFIPPTMNENGDKMIYCPMCECEISEDTCYDILYDHLTYDVPGIITEEEIEEKEDICNKCRYNDD